jgi:hypothetical protein
LCFPLAETALGKVIAELAKESVVVLAVMYFKSGLSAVGAKVVSGHFLLACLFFVCIMLNKLSK